MDSLFGSLPLLWENYYFIGPYVNDIHRLRFYITSSMPDKFIKVKVCSVPGKLECKEST